MTLFASSFLLHLSLACTYIFVIRSGKRPKNRFHAIKIFFVHVYVCVYSGAYVHRKVNALGVMCCFALLFV